MAASGSGGGAARPWTATSTWAPSGGAAVADAVSFETTEVDAEEAPAGVVLTRPDEDGDAPPCEVTVSFRGMYEIHRVYVKSTARIYEIYQSTDTKVANKDYLCTVRCGLATKEPQPSVTNAPTSEKREHEAKSVSSSSSDDSWVDVKISESPNRENTSESQERDVAGASQENNLPHYEATAEMTDVSPCVSLTVRLLSLQSKTSVHIEEIYIFADPVESTNDDSVTGPGNMGGSSLLAMLVPGLMQMSKSRSYNIDDGYFSHGSRGQPAHDRAVNDSSPCVTGDSKYKPAGIERGIDSTDGGTVSNEKNNQDQVQYKDPVSVQLPVQTTQNMQVPPAKDQLVSNTNCLANPLMNGALPPYTHIERKLDTLLSKVEKMELYCSRFEDSMIKPLGSIEARLQRLEQQFDSFSVEIQSLRDSSRMSAQDGPSSQEVHNDGNARTPASISDRKPSLFVKAPDFSSEDSCNYNGTDGNQVNFCEPNMVPKLLVKVPEFISQRELTGEKLLEGPISPVCCAPSSEQKDRKTSPGLAIKVPEFPDDDDDDDEIDEEEQTEVGDHDDSSNSKNRVSVNGALASALEALLMSTKGTSSSKSVVCPASSVSVENTNGPSSCSVSAGNVDEMSTTDGSINQIPYNVVTAHNINTIETVSDKDCGLENMENSARLSLGLNFLYSQCSAADSQKNVTEKSSFNWSLEGSFSKPNMEDSCSDSSTMESFGGVRASQPVFAGSTTAGKCVEDLFPDTGVSSTVTLAAGEELQKVCDLLYDTKDDMLHMTSIEKRTSKSSPSLEVLLAESSDSEAPTSGMENIDNDAGIGSSQLFGSLSSSDDSASAPTEPLVDVVDLGSEPEAYAATFTEPLVDVVDLPSESEASAASLNEPLFDVAGLMNPSGTHAPVVDLPTSSETASGVNEPLVDVVDQPTISETASSTSEPLANVDDLPKPSETFAGGSSGEHPNSLI